VNKAVFLDRDGVINKAVVIEGRPYPPASLQQMELLPGVAAGILLLKQAGYLVFVATNQPDVARGKTPQAAVDEINHYLQNHLHIDEVYCCYHDGIENCDCRKPKPGMLLQAAAKYDVDLNTSFMVGDRWRDIEAGIQAGVTTVLIDYQYDEKKVAANFTCNSFSEAVGFILQLTT
jgi:D-glycero-D-manno-heptose 1,7-bisphosphate phosphatase